MSLFSCKSWWSTRCGQEEEFDVGCMAVGDADNDPARMLEVVVGSFDGLLRVFRPVAEGFRAEHLLIEQNIGEPIIGVAVGRFWTDGLLHIAALHPRSLAIYTLSSQQQAYEIRKEHEHQLEHTAANMAQGEFGRTRGGSEMLCVQSMDGQLSFFEGRKKVFHVYLSGFLVPGPLAYLPATDSILTANSAFEVECYSYQTLASAVSEKVGAAGNPLGSPESAKDEKALKGQKRLLPAWKVVVGENALDMRTAPPLRPQMDPLRSQGDILVLCNHAVWCLTSQGDARWMKRLDYDPTALHVVPTDPQVTGVNYHCMIATHTGALMLYREGRLVWSAKSEKVPVCLTTGSFGGIPGIVVALDDEGSLDLSYLGTDPPLNVVQVVDSKDLDFDAMDREHQDLLQKIREHAAAQDPSAAAHAPSLLQLRTQVPVLADPTDDPRMHDPLSGIRNDARSRCVTATLYVTYTGAQSTGGTSITVECPAGVFADNPRFELPGFRGGTSTPQMAKLRFTYAGAHVPPSRVAKITAYSQTPQGEPRVTSADVVLPLALFVELDTPVREAAFKLTISTNRDPPRLSSLFDDVLQSTPGTMKSAAGGSNVLTFRFMSGEDVTIIVSKNAGRYRIQSDTFHAMWLVVEELRTRLRELYKHDTGEEPFSVSYEEPLPLADVFDCVDKHFDVRRRLSQLGSQLESRVAFLRSVQKRLLVRFRDKAPEPLRHLDTLLSSTMGQVESMAANVEACQREQQTARWELAGAVRLLVHLCGMQFGLSESKERDLSTYLPAEVPETPTQGWEEAVEASMGHLLRTTMAKGGDGATVAKPLEELEDTSLLKRHMSMVLERLGQGMTLTADEE
ncbi:unnamed protein product [Pedinophyceae sp. YPF-701]|nr:unnamed protein product [Pedinophyceae sp. YPF-701]